MNDLALRLAAIERRLEQIPARWEQPDRTLRFVIAGGNDLATISGITYRGIKGDNVPDIPAATPTFNATYPPGIGYGYPVASDGTVGTQLVWLVAGYRSTLPTLLGGIMGNFPTGTLVWSDVPRYLPLSGGSGNQVAVYLIRGF